MWALAKPEPVTKELIPARGDHPAVTATFNPQPSPLSLRAARRAVAEIMRADPAGNERAGDAFTGAIIRYNLLGWSGIVDEKGEVIEPTHDVEIHDDEGRVIEVQPGTISAFIAEPRLFEAADREYVLPWTQVDAEKNGFVPLPNGTSEGATPETDTVTSPVTPESSGDVTSAPIESTKPKRKRAKPSGK